MKYLIKPGLAALVYVYCDEFPDNFGERRAAFVYLAEGKLPDGNDVPFNTLPLEVRAAINRHFGTVFAIPIERRGEYLKNLQPWEIEA